MQGLAAVLEEVCWWGTLKTNVTVPSSYGWDREPAGAVEVKLSSLHLLAFESQQRSRKPHAGPSPSCAHTYQLLSGCPGGVMPSLLQTDLPTYPLGNDPLGTAKQMRLGNYAENTEFKAQQSMLRTSDKGISLITPNWLNYLLLQTRRQSAAAKRLLLDALTSRG